MKNDSNCVQVRGKNGRIHFFPARWIDLDANQPETDLYDRIEALKAQNADLLAAAEALLDRLDTMTMEEFRHGGEREQRESLRAEVQKSKLEASK